MRSNGAILNRRMRLLVSSLWRGALSNWSACRTGCRLRCRARRRLRSPHRAVLTAAPASRNTTPANPPFWRRWPLAAACAIIAFLAMGTIVALGVASAPKLWSPQTDLQRSQALVVLPFAADNSGQPDDPAFARVLTHNLIGYLSRFGKLRVISEQTSDFYRDRRMDLAHLLTDLGVQYAIVSRVQVTDRDLRI